MLTALTSFWSYAQKAQKGNVGKLESYVHSYVADPALTFDDSYTYSLTRTASKALLIVSFGKQENPAIEVNDEVLQKVEEMIQSGRLYETDKAKVKWKKKHPATAHSSETIMMSFKGDKQTRNIIAPSTQHREGIEKLDSYLAKVYKNLTKRIPDGDMVYCSCSVRHHGLPVGEIQREFYELIADKDKAPKVVHGVERDGKVEKTEHAATAENVAQLYATLSDLNVIQIKNYHAEEPMSGGTTYRVYMEFSSGEKLNANWLTKDPNPLAARVFRTILQNLSNLAK